MDAVCVRANLQSAVTQNVRFVQFADTRNAAVLLSSWLYAITLNWAYRAWSWSDRRDNHTVTELDCIVHDHDQTGVTTTLWLNSTASCMIMIKQAWQPHHDWTRLYRAWSWSNRRDNHTMTRTRSWSNRRNNHTMTELDCIVHDHDQTGVTTTPWLNSTLSKTWTVSFLSPLLPVKSWKQDFKNHHKK